jgi:photosystem II stability/assembly factor-like uncharacterized protein
MSRAIACLLLLLGGCALPDVHFACDTSDQCGAGGTCVDHGCAFASASCDSGLRFDPSVTDGRAGTCVPITDGGTPLDFTADDLATPPDLKPTPFTWTVSTVANGSAELRGVFGISAADVYVVGTAGTVLHTTDSGVTWIATSWAPTTTKYDFNAIWGFNAANMWAVGTYGAILRANGNFQLTTEALNYHQGVWGSSGADVYTVGHAGPAPGTGAISHSTNGSIFDPVTTPLGTMRGIWGSSSARVYAVGDLGVIRISVDQGMTWTMPSVDPASGSLYAVWGAGPEVFVVGDGGTILHSTDQGMSFSLFAPAPTTQRLRSIWGAGPNDIYIVGDQGVILHSNDDGASWHGPPGEGVSMLPITNLLGVWASSSDDVYIVGAAGTIAHGHR